MTREQVIQSAEAIREFAQNKTGIEFRLAQVVSQREWPAFTLDLIPEYRLISISRFATTLAYQNHRMSLFYNFYFSSPLQPSQSVQDYLIENFIHKPIIYHIDYLGGPR